MVKEGIFYGLKMALEKGESLEKAMMSFYLAGYSKEDIEGAAQELNNSSSNSLTQPATPNPVEIKKLEQTKSVQEDTTTKLPLVQDVSQYSEKKSSFGKRAIILIIIALIFLVLVGLITFLFYGNTILTKLFG